MSSEDSDSSDSDSDDEIHGDGFPDALKYTPSIPDAEPKESAAVDKKTSVAKLPSRGEKSSSTIKKSKKPRLSSHVISLLVY